MKKLIFVYFIFLSISAKSQSVNCSMVVNVEKAFFYDKTIVRGRPEYIKRTAYMVYGDTFTVPCSVVNLGWIYVVFRNANGVITKGYVRSIDVELIGD